MNVVVAVLLEKMVSHEPEGGKGQHSLGPLGPLGHVGTSGNQWEPRTRRGTVEGLEHC